MDRGISGSGAGFEGPSAGRLGSHGFVPVHNPPERRAREVALRVRGGLNLHALDALGV